LRFGSEFRTVEVKTHLEFSADGGMAGLAGMCSGVGQCRQRMVGTMCPSFIATGDELHTTRARANALRVALSNRDLLDGLDDPQLDEDDSPRVHEECARFEGKRFSQARWSRALCRTIARSVSVLLFAPKSRKMEV